MAVPVREGGYLAPRSSKGPVLVWVALAGGYQSGDAACTGDDMGIERCAQVGVANDAHGIIAAFDAGCELGIVSDDCSHAHHDGGCRVTLLVHVPTGTLACDPARLARYAGNLPVDGHGVLHGHQGTSCLDVREECLVEGEALIGQHAFAYLDAGLAQNPYPLSRHLGVRVRRANDHPRDSRLDDGVGAGGLPAKVAAGLERHIHGGTAHV